MRHGLDTSFLVAVEVACHAEHASARATAEALRRNDDRFAIAPQVVAEFVHVVTDAKRFSAPLTIERALERAKVWWDAKDVDQVLPDQSTVAWFLTANGETPTWTKTRARHVAGRNFPHSRCLLGPDAEPGGFWRLR